IVSPFDSYIPLASARAFFAQMLKIDMSEELEKVRKTIQSRVQALFHHETNDERQWIEASFYHLFRVSDGKGAFEELSGEERQRRLFITLRNLLNSFAKKKALVL